MVCKNGGSLDLNTCTCKCASEVYSGDQCEIEKCKRSDGLEKICANNAELDPETCECKCIGLTEGEECYDCKLTLFKKKKGAVRFGHSSTKRWTPEAISGPIFTIFWHQTAWAGTIFSY